MRSEPAIPAPPNGRGLECPGHRPQELARSLTVQGIAVGAGHIAVQIAKAFGAHVIGTARIANHGLLRDLGADALIDYTLDDFATAVRDVDIVLDNIGHAYGPRSLVTLAPGGHLVSTIWDHPGVTAEDAARTGVRFDTVKVAPSAPDLEELGKLVEQGRIRVHVADVLPLRDAATGHRMSETGRVSGKLVLVP